MSTTQRRSSLVFHFYGCHKWQKSPHISSVKSFVKVVLPCTFRKEEKKRVEKQVCTETDGTLLYQYRKSVVVPPFDPFDNEEWKISKQKWILASSCYCVPFLSLRTLIQALFLLLPFSSYERTSFFSKMHLFSNRKKCPFFILGGNPTKWAHSQ